MKINSILIIIIIFLIIGNVVNTVAQDNNDPRVDPFTSEDGTANFGWFDNRDPESPRPSPNAVVGLQLGFTRIMIAYGSPGVKGREFGINLEHWESLWRTGANEGTTFTTTEDIIIEGEELKKGTYSIFTIPGQKEWTVIFNNNPKVWALSGYNPTNNVLRFKVPHQGTQELQEGMIFYFDEIDTENYTALVVLRWAKFKIAFKVQEP